MAPALALDRAAGRKEIWSGCWRMSRDATQTKAAVTLGEEKSGRTRMPMACPMPPLQPYQRCTCGVCGECVEDEKWDRIFAKFDITNRPVASAAVEASFPVSPARAEATAAPACNPLNPSPLPDGWAGVWARMTDAELESAARDYVWVAANVPQAGARRWEEIVAESQRRRRPLIVERAKVEWATRDAEPVETTPASAPGRTRRAPSGRPAVSRAGDRYL